MINPMDTQPELKRTLSLLQLTLYGIGTILGAGIYVLMVCATASMCFGVIKVTALSE